MEKILTPRVLEKLIELRKTIHANPDIAHNEFTTANTLLNFMGNKPDQIITEVGGTGIALVFNGAEKGETVLFRAELDALPIQEKNTFSYKSLKENISHKCGHDGHMAILAGLGILLAENKIKKGKVVLLFQPAEEVGEGALKVITDNKFADINPDYVFALHNLPGYEKNYILIKNENFAAASKGMIINLIGKTSHAAEPENGVSPAVAMTQIINELNSLITSLKGKLKDLSLVTVIHAILGEKAFGTSPGFAQVMATFRSYRNDDMKLIVESAEKIIDEIAVKENLKYEISFTEEFAATVNNNECIQLIKEIINEQKLNEIVIDKPFKWSEDFGHFTSKFKGALFGIGAGLQAPQLHNPDYDFPDDVIETGITVFYSLVKKILG